MRIPEKVQKSSAVITPTKVKSINMGAESVKLVTRELIRKSAWFCVEPNPCDLWSVWHKPEVFPSVPWHNDDELDADEKNCLVAMVAVTVSNLVPFWILETCGQYFDGEHLSQAATRMGDDTSLVVVTDDEGAFDRFNLDHDAWLNAAVFGLDPRFGPKWSRLRDLIG